MGANLFEKDKFKSKGDGVKAVTAEVIGTGFLVFFGCGACLNWAGIGSFTAAQPLQIAIAFGFIIASMVQQTVSPKTHDEHWIEYSGKDYRCFKPMVVDFFNSGNATIGHVSGCNINPAVTVGLLSCGRIGLLRAALYIPAQCVGAIAGAALLNVVSPEVTRGGLGTPGLGSGVTVMQGFLVEAIISCLLILVVCAVTDPHRMDIGNAAPVAIGLAITTSHIFAIPLTSSSMNPARALGPAVLTGGWDNHWIYWVGPLLGGIVGGLVYKLVFSASKDETTSYDL